MGVEVLRNTEQRLTTDKLSEDVTDPFCFLCNNFHGLARLLPVAEWWRGLHLTFLGHEGHFRTHFLGQPYRLEFIHPFDDALDQRTKHIIAGFFRNRNNLDTAFFPEQGLVQDTLFLVPGKTGILPDQYCIKRRRLGLGGSNHLLKGWSLLRITSTDTGIRINMFWINDDVMPCGIVLNFPKLRIGRVFRLVVGGNT